MARRWAVWMLTVLISTPTWAELNIKKLEYGLFTSVPFPQDFLDEDDGSPVNTSLEELQPAREIPAQLGVKFGIRFTVGGIRPVIDVDANDRDELHMIYLTPDIITPGGEHRNKFEVLERVTQFGSTKIMAFEFAEEYELATGTWEFLVFDEDRLLARERFEVVAP